MDKFFLINKALFILLSLTPLNLFSQSDNSYIELGVYHGFVLPHHPEFLYLIQQRETSYELNWSKKTDGEKLWQQLTNYPTWGISYFHSGLGNNEVFGKAHAGSFFLEKESNFAGKTQISYKTAFGVAYVNQPFNVTENIYNIANGSNFNAFLQLGFSEN